MQTPKKLWLLAALPFAVQAQITPNGDTATSVSTEPSGRTLVTMAPLDSDNTSHNRYSDFSVSTAGAALDNRELGARTIVNEVVGNRRSLIEGDLEVLGARAHMILANANGITIDGGNFINFGGLALGTGQIEFRTDEIAPGITQRRPVLTVGDGVVRVGPKGMSAALTQLHVLSRSMQVEGELQLGDDFDIVPLNATLAGTETSFDSSLPAASRARPWATTEISEPNGSTRLPETIGIDVSSNGALSAGRIIVRVTGDGVGVRHAGSALAAAGEFSINSDGDVEFIGADVRTAGDIVVTAPNVTVSASPDDSGGSSLVSVAGAVQVDTPGMFTNTGSLLEGGSANSDGVGVSITAGGDIVNNTLEANNRGILFARDGDLRLESGGTVVNNTGRLIANQNVEIDAAEGFDNIIPESANGATAEPVVTFESYKRLWYTLWLKREKIKRIEVDYGERELAGENAFVVANGNIDIDAPVFRNIGGELNANDGDVKVNALQVVNRAVRSGQANFREHCGLICERSGQSTVLIEGGAINASGNIEIVAQESLLNSGGDMTALQGIAIDSPEVTIEALANYQVSTRPGGLRRAFSADEGAFLRSNQGGSLTANMGKIQFGDGNNVRVIGGRLNAAEGVESDTEIGVEVLPSDSPLQSRDAGILSSLF